MNSQTQLITCCGFTIVTSVDSPNLTLINKIKDLTPISMVSVLTLQDYQSMSESVSKESTVETQLMNYAERSVPFHMLG